VDLWLIEFWIATPLLAARNDVIYDMHRAGVPLGNGKDITSVSKLALRGGVLPV